MSRKAKFTPEEKEQAVIDYLEGNKFALYYNYTKQELREKKFYFFNKVEF